jgi:plastocyanin
MRSAAHRMSVVAAVALVILTGCGGSDDGAQTGESTSSASGAGGSASGPSASSQQPSASPSGDDSGGNGSGDGGGSPVETEDDAVQIEVEIENGQVTPSGERVDVEVGQTIRFVVDSDAADEIHVHSTPEHTFAFRAGADDREFEFRITQPGVVEAELHELGDVVVTLAARP